MGLPAGPAATRFVVGVDLGGTKILGYALDLATSTPRSAVVRTATPRGGPAIVASIVDVVRRLGDGAGELAGGRDPVAVGVGAPGLIDHAGVVRFAPNLPGVAEFELEKHLRDRLGVSVVVGNDATCAMVAEHRLGAARGAQEAVLVTLGTGIGAGLVVHGAVARGAHGFAGEPGHMVVDPSGPRCPCGRRGCWERFASGSGLGRLARDAAGAGRARAMVDLAGGDVAALRGEHVTAAAREGDAEAEAVLRRFAWWVALGIANLVNVVDPEVVVIGGGLIDAGELLLGPVREAFAELVLAHAHRPTPRIVPALLGSEAGAIGAALLASELSAGDPAADDPAAVDPGTGDLPAGAGGVGLH